MANRVVLDSTSSELLPSPPLDIAPLQLPHDERTELLQVCLVWSPSLLAQANRLSHILHDRYELFDYLFKTLSFSSLRVVAPKPVPLLFVSNF